MCGRENPAERDVCQFCEARLKPLTAPLSGDVPERKDPDDWLGSLRGEDEGDDGWADSEEDTPIDEFDLEDPLGRLGGLDVDADQPELHDDQESQGQAAPEPDEDEQATGLESEQVDLAAWLASLDQEDGEAPGERAQVASDLPDWLSQFAEPDTGDAGDVETSPDEALFEQEPSGVEEPLANALEGSGAGWESGAADSQEGEAPEDQLSEALPDWLAEIESPTSMAEAEGAHAESDLEGEEPLPEWLMEIKEAGEEVEPAEEGAGALPAEYVPDWLAELESGAQPVGELLDEAVLPEMTGSEAEGDEPAIEIEQQPEAEAPDVLEGEIPDWLAELEAVDIEAEADLESGEDQVSLAAAEDLDGVLASGELPEWLTDFGPEEDAGVEGDALAEAGAGESGDDWLAEIASGMPLSTDAGAMGLEGEDEEAQPVLFTQDDELDEELREMYLAEEPDWLADVTDEDAGVGRDANQVEAEGLEHAQLPGWLEAMRPVGAVVTPQAQVDDEEGEFESTGPLAGLRDVLPAEAAVAAIRKPEALTVKLDVTDSQKKHIKLLDELLQAEEEPYTLGKAPAIASQNVLRILIGLILIVAVLITIRTGSQGTALPLPAPEVRDANRLISSLAPQSPVLLVFDYEPGLAGEMDVVASTVIDHLMLRGVDLTLVSTTPSGPLLGERVLVQLGSRHVYARGEQYVNLGFIPGGSAGVQSLTQFPLRFSLPYALGEVENYDPWMSNQRPLSQVSVLADYALLVVITDRQEAARSWIEQAGPVLAGTPMILATSAQLEPLVRPYYEGSPQLVDGFLSGLVGGAAYERQLGITGQARLYWDTYSNVVLVSTVVILLGAVLNLLAGAISKGQPNKGKRSDEPA